MNGSKRNLRWAAVFGAIGLFSLLALVGVPLGSLFILGVLLTCPLLMAGMHMGSGSGHAGHGANPGDHLAPHKGGGPRPSSSRSSINSRPIEP